MNDAPGSRRVSRVLGNGPGARTRPGAGWAGLVATVLVVGFVAGCTPPIAQYVIRDEALSCRDANRYAYDTLKAMGFTVTGFEPAVVGGRGWLAGTRQLSGRRSATRKVRVAIDCSAAGAAVDAREEGKLLGQLDFKRGFYMSFSSVRSMAVSRAKMAVRRRAGTAPASLQRADLSVRVEPIEGPAAKLDFGIDMAAGGILPVRIHIENLTSRNYRLDPASIRLSRLDRKRVSAVTPEEAAKRISGAHYAADGRPVTSLSDGEIAARLRKKLFVRHAVDAGASVEGFLYFPAGAYRRGRVVLTETSSEEAEGFLVEF